MGVEENTALEKYNSMGLIALYERTAIKSPNAEISDSLIDAIVGIKPFKGELERKLIFHRSFIEIVSASLDPAIKATWIKTVLDPEGIPVNGEFISIMLSQLIALGELIEPPVVRFEITSLSRSFAIEGELIMVNGSGFTGVRGIQLQEIDQTTTTKSTETTVLSDTQITFIADVPNGDIEFESVFIYAYKNDGTESNKVPFSVLIAAK